MVATWLGPTSPNSRIISTPTADQPPTVIVNDTIGIQVSVPAGWVTEISEFDPVDPGNITTTTKFEIYDPSLGQDQVQVSFTTSDEITEGAGERAELTSYKSYEAEMIEITNDFGLKERSYYLRKPQTTGYVVVSVRTNEDPGIMQQLQAIEQSFRLLGAEQ